MPSKGRAELVQRIATLEPVKKEVLRELDTTLQQRLQEQPELLRPPLAGAKQVAKLLQHLEPDRASSILTEIETSNPPLGEEIRDAMLTFEDLVQLDTKNLTKLYQSLPSTVWATALLGKNNSLLPKVFEILSPRAQVTLQEDMDTRRGRTRLSELRQAHRIILEKVKELMESGQIELPDPGDPYV